MSILAWDCPMRIPLPVRPTDHTSDHTSPPHPSYHQQQTFINITLETRLNTRCYIHYCQATRT